MDLGRIRRLVHCGLLVLSVAWLACGARTGLRGQTSSREDDEQDASVALDSGPPIVDASVEDRPVRPKPPPGKADKIDLLFMIDSSGSMADKQEILALAIPDMVKRLTNPLCIDASGKPLPNSPPNPTDACPSGSKREFSPTQDMHIGVISSSLGGHGSQRACGNPRYVFANDQAHLLQRGAQGETYENLGFLAWDPGQTKQPAGETDPNKLEDLVRRIVRGVGETGCGFEASLEAWYHFLIDPEPWLSVELEPCPNSQSEDCAVLRGVDEYLLEQRKNFLRPDSLVAVIMLSDENDCSVIDGGRAWRVVDLVAIPRATTVCDTNPLDACCRSCADTTQIAGCAPPADDPECQKGPYTPDENGFGIHCYEQKRRFGVDYLYPIERYVRGMTEEQVPARNGKLVQNPLFAPNEDGETRHHNLVVLAGIVGVPWQDLARDPKDQENLEYKTARELREQGIWDIVVGDPTEYRPALDPLMHESVPERTGVNPITLDPLMPSSATSPTANPINGHEFTIDTRMGRGFELQYACIFPLITPRNCIGQVCDCHPLYPGGKRPLCQAEDGSYDTIQYRAKAYPGLRQLAVLKGLGDNAIAASICARNVTDPSRPDYGYRPALSALLDRLRAGLI
jgi:hypothetical protein